MAIRLASNLLKSRHGIYYFRLVFPKHLKSPKSELRLSLMTHSSAKAKQQAIFLKMAVEPYLANLSTMTNKEYELLKSKLKSLSKSWNEEGEKLVLKGLKLLDLEIEKVEVNGKEDSEHFTKMVENLAQKKGNKLQVEPNTVLVSEGLTNFFSYLQHKGKKVKAKTISQYEASFRDFIEIIGDVPMSQLTELDIVRYREILIQLPPNRNKLKEFRDLTIFEAAEKNTGDTVSTTTVINNMTRVSTLIKWCVQKKYLDYNIVTEYIPEPDQIKQDSRLSFDEKDIQELFRADELFKFNPKNSTTYTIWSHWLALYTGARLEEISRLRIADIDIEAPIPHIHIQPYYDDEYQVELPLKTLNSKRMVPLHPDLKKLGFFDYVKVMKKKGHYRLFPELALLRDGFGARVGKWFIKYKNKILTCDKSKRDKKSFHSFRHTVINRLIDQDFAIHRIEDLVGHRGNRKSTVETTYKDRPDLSKQNELIKSLKYDLDDVFPKMKKLTKELVDYIEEYKPKTIEELKPSMAGRGAPPIFREKGTPKSRR